MLCIFLQLSDDVSVFVCVLCIFESMCLKVVYPFEKVSNNCSILIFAYCLLQSTIDLCVGVFSVNV